MLSSVSGVIGLFTLLNGMWHLHRSLNPTKRNATVAEPTKTFAAPKTTALPPRTAQSSVTEGTTALLFLEEQKRERIPVKHKVIDTAEVR